MYTHRYRKLLTVFSLKLSIILINAVNAALEKLLITFHCLFTVYVQMRIDY